MAKHVAHHKHVAVFIVHTNSVHAQELGQQCVAMALHNVLGWKGGRNGERLSSRYTNSPGFEFEHNHSRVSRKLQVERLQEGQKWWKLSKDAPGYPSSFWILISFD